jgi:hypothetical protein
MTPEVDDEVRREVLEVSKDNYCLVAPNIVSAIASRFSRESVFYTDGSRTANMTGFGSIMALQTKFVTQKIHPLVFACKEALWCLSTMGYSVSLAWIPAHVGIQGNERSNALAKSAAIEDVYLQASPISSDFIPLARSRIQNEWQEK